MHKWRPAHQIQKFNQRGIAAVEVAIVLPFLLFLMVIVLDFGRVMHTGVVTSNAARSAAGYGAQNTTLALDETGMNTAALADSVDLAIDSGNSDHVVSESRHFCTCPNNSSEVSCTSSGCGVAPEVYVEVTTTRKFNLIANIFGLPESIDLNHTAVMRVQ